MRYICKLDKNLYRCVTEDITTDEVIITEERIEHIRQRHPNDYERFVSFFPQIIENPDYILEANKQNTAFILKEVEAAGQRFELILRLHTSNDKENNKNSIITFLAVQEKRYERYLRTKNILYRRT